MPDTALEIALLGSPRVTVGGRPVEVDTRKAIALLAYLAIEGTSARDTLATLFWAEAPSDRARATLRRTLSSLRGGVGPDAITADRNQVNLVGGYRCDVHVFESALAETRSHGHDAGDVCPNCIPSLRRATELYRGDFLGAFTVRDAPDFEDWARVNATSLRMQAGDTWKRLSMAHASTGNYTAAIAAAKRWIDLDELHEPAHRHLMLLNAWAGDRAGSIAAFRSCVAVLDRELGVAPLEETSELYEAILDEDLPPAPAVRRPVRSHSAPDPPPDAMVDRLDAIARLREAVERISEGYALLAVTGGSWMGKTRLLEFVTAIAESNGILVVSARAYRTETELPFGVVTQLLDALTPHIEAVSGHLPEWVLSELSRLHPGFSHSQPVTGPEAFGELRIREAVVSVLSSIADQRQLIITVDDVQWMDTASLALLAHVDRRAGVMPLRVFLSAREPNTLGPLHRDLLGQSGETITLGPLVAADLGGYDLADPDSVVDATGGIPLLVLEAIESTSDTPDSASVTRYLESRVEALSDLSRQVITTIAVLDGMCDAPLLTDTSGRTDDEIVEAVEELTASYLIKESGEGLLSFTLETLATLLYESTSMTRRRLLHKRAAAALQRRGRARSDLRLASAIAKHLRLAENDQAAAWYRIAGDLARDVYAHTEAATAYETAIALGGEDTAELRLSLGELALARADYDTAARELQLAAAHADALTLALVEHRLGELRRRLGRFDLAEESFRRASDEHPNPADLYSDWALLRHRVGDDENAVAFAQRAVSISESRGIDIAVSRHLNVLAVVTKGTAEALKHLDRALDLARDPDPVRMAALNNKAHILAGRGHFEDAAELVTQAIDIAEHSGHRHHQAALLDHLADIYHQLGRETDSEQTLKAAVRLFAEIDAGERRPEIWLLRQW